MIQVVSVEEEEEAVPLVEIVLLVLLILKILLKVGRDLQIWLSLRMEGRLVRDPMVVKKSPFTIFFKVFTVSRECYTEVRT